MLLLLVIQVVVSARMNRCMRQFEPVAKRWLRRLALAVGAITMALGMTAVLTHAADGRLQHMHSSARFDDPVEVDDPVEDGGLDDLPLEPFDPQGDMTDATDDGRHAEETDAGSLPSLPDNAIPLSPGALGSDDISFDPTRPHHVLVFESVPMLNAWAALCWFWPEVAALAFVGPSLVLLFVLHRRRHLTPGREHCRKCYYCLQDPRATRCSECGAALDRRRSRVRGRRVGPWMTLAAVLIVAGVFNYLLHWMHAGRFGAYSHRLHWPSIKAYELAEFARLDGLLSQAGSQDVLVEVDVATGATTRRTRPLGMSVYRQVASAESGRLYVYGRQHRSSEPKRLTVVDLANNRVEKSFECDLRTAYPLAAGGDGRVVFAAYGIGEAMDILDTRTGQWTRWGPFLDPNDARYAGGVSMDMVEVAQPIADRIDIFIQQYLLEPRHDGYGDRKALLRWTVGGSTEAEVVCTLPMGTESVEVSPDGRTAHVATPRRIIQIDLADCGTTPTPWDYEEAQSASIAVSPDGRWLVACSDSSVWSRRRAWAGSEETTVSLFDLETGSFVKAWSLGGWVPFLRLAISPDSRYAVANDGNGHSLIVLHLMANP